MKEMKATGKICFLELLSNVSLEDGTQLKEFVNAEADGKDISWELAMAMPSKVGGSASRVADGMDDDRTNFSMEKGQSAKGPVNFGGKRITFRASVNPDVKSPSGVIAAIGGSDLGMAVYLKDRQVYACVRIDGDLKWVAKPAPLGGFEVEAILNNSGLSLSLDGGSEARRDDVELFESPSADGIDIGQDLGSPAGEYEDSFSFAGEIKDVRILIRE